MIRTTGVCSLEFLARHASFCRHHVSRCFVLCALQLQLQLQGPAVQRSLPVEPLESSPELFLGIGSPLSIVRAAGLNGCVDMMDTRRRAVWR
jgi:hypothetical protein